LPTKSLRPNTSNKEKAGDSNSNFNSNQGLTRECLDLHLLEVCQCLRACLTRWEECQCQCLKLIQITSTRLSWCSKSSSGWCRCNSRCSWCRSMACSLMILRIDNQ
jgi:hypothetical protein